MIMIERIPIESGLILYWTAAIIRVGLQGTLLLGFIWIILRIFPKIQPNIRGWLWRIVYLKFVISFIEIQPFKIWLYVRKSLAVPLDQLLHPASYFPVPTLGAIQKISDPIQELYVFNQWKFWFMIWVLGVIFEGFRLFFLWNRNRILWKDKYPMNHPVLENLYTELCAQLKIKRPPQLFWSDSISSPSLQGLIHPMIILPAAVLTEYRPEETQMMLAHELAHYKRRDLWWNWLPMIAHGLYFFHPLIWLVEREWKESQEICCDHLAVQYTGARRVEYGKVLVKAACRRVAFESWFNLSSSLRYQGAQFYNPRTKQILKKRLVALDSSELCVKKRLLVLALMLTLFGWVIILPWKVYPIIDFRLGLNTVKSAPTLAADRQYDTSFWRSDVTKTGL